MLNRKSNRLQGWSAHCKKENVASAWKRIPVPQLSTIQTKLTPPPYSKWNQ
jgi:hypothetical protein